MAEFDDFRLPHVRMKCVGCVGAIAEEIHKALCVKIEGSNMSKVGKTALTRFAGLRIEGIRRVRKDEKKEIVGFYREDNTGAWKQESGVDTMRSTEAYEFRPMVPGQFLMEYWYVFRVLKHNTVKWEFLWRLDKRKRFFTEGLSGTDCQVQLPFCQKIMGLLVRSVMPTSKLPLFNYGLDVTLMKSGGTELTWLNDIKLLPADSSEMVDARNTVAAISKMCLSAQDYVQRFVMGNGDDLFVSWPG